MGSADGGSPGRIVRLNGDFSVRKEWPELPPEGFNPHGYVCVMLKNCQPARLC